MESMYDRIQALLERKSMTKKDLAIKANIPYQSLISAFRRSSEGISMDYTKRIAAALGVTVADLLNWEDKEMHLSAEVALLDKAKEIGGAVYALNDAFSRLNPAGQQKAVDYLNDLLLIDAYRVEE